jgi:hypothetical protein
MTDVEFRIYKAYMKVNNKMRSSINYKEENLKGYFIKNRYKSI